MKLGTSRKFFHINLCCCALYFEQEMLTNDAFPDINQTCPGIKVVYMENNTTEEKPKAIV